MGYGIDSSNRRIEANIVTSAYGKENFIYWIEKNIQCKSIKYINNKKIKELQSEGVQFPNRL